MLMMQQAEGAGIKAERIVLGGFSQGAVLALQAGLTFERQIAGTGQAPFKRSPIRSRARAREDKFTSLIGP